MTGLVLAGGGAKGAYQIGAWKYLREQGIEFDVISGTSIGALNAALVASGELDKAQTFWRSLSTRRLVRIEPLLLLGLVLRLFSIVLPGRRVNQIHSARELRYSIKFNAIVAVALAVLFIVPEFFLSMPASVLLSSSALVVLFLVVLLLLPNIAELINGALISRRALSRLVEEKVDWIKIAAGRPAVFVTIARVARVRHRRKVTLVIPDYARLSTLDTSQARDCLTASMALPFGIFPRIEIDGKRYMDGGVADNIPVYPAVLEECRVIYVVHLSPKPRYRGLDLLDDEQLEAAMTFIDLARNETGEPGLYQRNWFKQRLKIMASMRALCLDEGAIWDYMEKRFDRPGDGNVKIVHIVPQRRLGWGLLGTLIFCRAKTERLLAMGYQDAKATLSGRRPLPASRSGWQERWERRGFLLLILVSVLPVLGMLGLLLLVRYLKSGS